MVRTTHSNATFRYLPSSDVPKSTSAQIDECRKFFIALYVDHITLSRLSTSNPGRSAHTDLDGSACGNYLMNRIKNVVKNNPRPLL